MILAHIVADIAYSHAGPRYCRQAEVFEYWMDHTGQLSLLLAVSLAETWVYIHLVALLEVAGQQQGKLSHGFAKAILQFVSLNDCPGKCILLLLVVVVVLHGLLYDNSSKVLVRICEDGNCFLTKCAL